MAKFNRIFRADKTEKKGDFMTCVRLVKYVILLAPLAMVGCSGEGAPKAKVAAAKAGNESSELPDQIAYLAPTLEALGKLPLDSLGDDNSEAMGLVEKAVRERVKGMSAEEARKTIGQDNAVLSQWATKPNVPPAAGYVMGSMMGMMSYADFEELTK